MVDITDPKMKELYISTAREYVQALSRDLQSLLQDMNNPNYVSQIRISAHSLKGQSRVAGYQHIATISELIEERMRSNMEEHKPLKVNQVLQIFHILPKLSASIDAIQNGQNELNLSEDETALRGALEA